MSNTIVRTNVMSLNSHRNLGLVGNQQNRASQRLSSGFRINSAADDAAGLGISEKMRSQIRGLDQASRNGQDGISLIQTAEGAMSTINEMVTRIRELVIQASNDTNAHDGSDEATWNQSDRTRIQAEINQLMNEIDATTERTQFNTRNLLDGSLGGGVGGLNIIGAAAAAAEFATFRADATAAITDEVFDGDLDAAIDDLIDGGGLSATAGLALRNQVARAVDSVISQIMGASSRASADAAMDNFDDVMSNIRDNFEAAHRGVNTDTSGDLTSNFEAVLDAIADGSGAAAGAIRDLIQDALDALDAAENFEQNDEGMPGPNASTAGTGSVFQLNGSGSGNPLWFQIGANENQGVTLSIDAVNVQRLSNRGAAAATAGFLFTDLRTDGIGLGQAGTGVMRESGEEIQNFVTAIDMALSHVTEQRSNLGAMQNRLEFTIQNLDISSENLSNANSRIRDADMAAEMMRLTQSNVLQQAAISMLAQANQAPQSVLQLLG